MHPNIDKEPLEYTYELGAKGKKKWACDPGKCEYYTSQGFILLGYVMAQEQGIDSWDQVDQWAGVPEHLRKKFKDTVFPMRGKCSDYPNIAHTYAQKSRNNWPGLEIGYHDMWNTSCSNGWTSGNIAISSHDAALWMYEYIGTTNILNSTTKDLL